MAPVPGSCFNGGRECRRRIAFSPGVPALENLASGAPKPRGHPLGPALPPEPLQGPSPASICSPPLASGPGSPWLDDCSPARRSRRDGDSRPTEPAASRPQSNNGQPGAGPSSAARAEDGGVLPGFLMPRGDGAAADSEEDAAEDLPDPPALPAGRLASGVMAAGHTAPRQPGESSFSVFLTVWYSCSKTDQEGRGPRVVLFAVPGSDMCPVQCLGAFWSQWGGGSGDRPLLVHENGSFLLRFQFVSVFRMAVRSLGLEAADYSGHSFRIGAASFGDTMGCI